MLGILWLLLSFITKTPQRIQRYIVQRAGMLNFDHYPEEFRAGDPDLSHAGTTAAAFGPSPVSERLLRHSEVNLTLRTLRRKVGAP
jgi:hypothetical protein